MYYEIYTVLRVLLLFCHSYLPRYFANTTESYLKIMLGKDYTSCKQTNAKFMFRTPSKITTNEKHNLMTDRDIN